MRQMSRDHNDKIKRLSDNPKQEKRYRARRQEDSEQFRSDEEWPDKKKEKKKKVSRRGK